MTLSSISTESVQKPQAKQKGKGTTRNQRKRAARVRNEVAFKNPIVQQCGDELVVLIAGKCGGVKAPSHRKLRVHLMNKLINPALGRRRTASFQSRSNIAASVIGYAVHEKWVRIKKDPDGLRLCLTELGSERAEELISKAEEARSQRRAG